MISDKVIEAEKNYYLILMDKTIIHKTKTQYLLLISTKVMPATERSHSFAKMEYYDVTMAF
jgi:hypothetical protein